MFCALNTFIQRHLRASILLGSLVGATVTLLKSARPSGTPTKVQIQGNLMCQTVEGIARVRWNGKQVYCASVKNPATVKCRPVGGIVLGVVYDGN